MADSIGGALEACNSQGMLLPSTNLRSMEALLLAAQQQQLRQLRHLKQLKRQAEMSAAVEAEWAVQKARDEERRAARDAGLLETAAQRAAHAADVEQRRQVAAAAALERQAAIQAAYQAKLDEAERRAEDSRRRQQLLSEFNRISGAKQQLRRQHVSASRDDLIQARRQALAAHEEHVEQRQRQRQELKELEGSIKREEQSTREMQRAEARLRAEQEEEAKRTYYAIKQDETDRKLEARKEEAAQQQRLRSKDARTRYEQLHQRTEVAAQLEVENRAALANRLASKMQRADAIFEQRAAFTQEVQRINKSMALQEQQMKEVLGKAQLTGKWEFPEELLQNLAALESTITSPYASPRGERAQSPGAGGGSSGRASPSQLLSGAPYSPRYGCLISGSSGREYDAGSDQEEAALALRSVPRSASPRALMSSGGGVSAAEARQQEAALQAVLEEEILKEMQREALLRQAASADERRKLIRKFAAEREAAKERILLVGSTLNATATAGAAAAATAIGATGAASSDDTCTAAEEGGAAAEGEAAA